MLIIRPEGLGDVEAIHAVHVRAFPTSLEARLVDLLRAAGRLTMSLVAVADEAVVGHVAFSPVTVANGATGIGLAPVAVSESHRRQGVAARLIGRAGRLSDRRVRWAVVLGEPHITAASAFSRRKFGLSDEYGGAMHSGSRTRSGGLADRGRVCEVCPEFSSLG